MDIRGCNCPVVAIGVVQFCLASYYGIGYIWAIATSIFALMNAS